jgi:hypothetical protein
MPAALTVHQRAGRSGGGGAAPLRGTSEATHELGALASDQREHLRGRGRPPVAENRLALSASGKVGYTLKTPYRDGTTHIVLEPLDCGASIGCFG